MINDILATHSRPSHRPDQLVRRLSHPQIYNLHLCLSQQAETVLHGMVARGSSQMGVTEIMKIPSLAIIRSLWRMGLLDGTPDAQLYLLVGTLLALLVVN